MRITVMGSGQGFGGLQTHFALLLEFLVAEGHEVLALVVADPGVAFEPPSGLSGCVRIRHAATTLGQKLGKHLGLRSFQAETRRFAPQLFIAAALGRGYLQVSDYARRSGAFVIWQEVTNPVPMDLLRLKMRACVHAVAVQSPVMRSSFCQAIPGTSAVGCLPCFFEPPNSGAIASLPNSMEAVRFAYFGRLAPNKGLVPFLNAVHEASRRHRISFDIHGGGEERNALQRRIADLDLARIVQLRGPYPSGCAYGNLLVSYHSLLLPSRDSEGVPLVLIEAMSCGLPFLATNIGGIPDVAIDNPDVLTVCPTDAALSLGLMHMIESLTAHRLSNARLRNHYELRFSRESIVGVWRTMLADPPRFFRE